MKHIKALALFTAFALPLTTQAQISPNVGTQIQNVTKRCTDSASLVMGQDEVTAKALAEAALPKCYDALRALDQFEKTNGAALSADERNYFYYMGGNIIWLTAGSEVMKNNGNLTPQICQQVIAAESAWGNVRVAEGTDVDVSMRTHDLRRMLVPVCQVALGQK
ncbi:hypothetical protein [Hellea balneolensis]|uniref:hypothetical protein n=1 Tax=Hellea balneolensis TaxID=287478 RepID=UPI000405FC48|nr:hypothetical protein [Hellea balneolensis]